MKWRVVQMFYHQMRHHITFSILTDGFGTFCRNTIKNILKADKPFAKAD
jgi:hypothetical protein